MTIIDARQNADRNQGEKKMTDTTKPKRGRGRPPNPDKRPLTPQERTTRRKERLRSLIEGVLVESRETKALLHSLAQKAESTKDLAEARACVQAAFLAASGMMDGLETAWNARLQIEGSAPVTTNS